MTAPRAPAGFARLPPAAGFTLVEVAAALAVAAGSLAVLLAAFGDGGRAADRAAAQRMALLVAQSALAEAARAGARLSPGARWGGAGQDLAWLVEVSDWPEAPAGPAGLPAPRLLSVTVRGGADGRGPVLARLATIRLGPAAPAATATGGARRDRR